MEGGAGEEPEFEELKEAQGGMDVLMHLYNAINERRGLTILARENPPYDSLRVDLGATPLTN